MQKSRLQNPGLDFREGLPGPSPPNSRLAAWTLDLDSGFWISAPRAESKRFLESRLAEWPLDLDSAFWILSQLACKIQAWIPRKRQPRKRSSRLAALTLDLDSGFWIAPFCIGLGWRAKAEWTSCEPRSSPQVPRSRHFAASTTSQHSSLPPLPLPLALHSARSEKKLVLLESVKCSASRERVMADEHWGPAIRLLQHRESMLHTSSSLTEAQRMRCEVNRLAAIARRNVRRANGAIAARMRASR